MRRNQHLVIRRLSWLRKDMWELRALLGDNPNEFEGWEHDLEQIERDIALIRSRAARHTETHEAA